MHPLALRRDAGAMLWRATSGASMIEKVTDLLETVRVGAGRKSLSKSHGPAKAEPLGKSIPSVAGQLLEPEGKRGSETLSEVPLWRFGSTKAVNPAEVM